MVAVVEVRVIHGVIVGVEVVRAHVGRIAPAAAEGGVPCQPSNGSGGRG